jgi:hypothetical protein
MGAVQTHEANGRSFLFDGGILCVVLNNGGQTAMKQGQAACATGCLPADKVETFVVDQIRRIGADTELQEQTFNQAAAQIKAQRRGLKLEQKQLERNLTKARSDVERFAETLSRTTGSSADAISGELGKAQELVRTLESRQAEIKTEMATLNTKAIDRADLADALEAFDPIWDVLLTPEKERVLKLLVAHIDYDGSTQRMTIHWRLSGFGQLADEVSS